MRNFGPEFWVFMVSISQKKLSSIYSCLHLTRSGCSSARFILTRPTYSDGKQEVFPGPLSVSDRTGRKQSQGPRCTILSIIESSCRQKGSKELETEKAGEPVGNLVAGPKTASDPCCDPNRRHARRDFVSPAWVPLLHKRRSAALADCGDACLWQMEATYKR